LSSTAQTATEIRPFNVSVSDHRAYAKKFSGPHSHRILEGIGHNVPQEVSGARSLTPFSKWEADCGELLQQSP
jgi:hypothetical protein